VCVLLIALRLVYCSASSPGGRHFYGIGLPWLSPSVFCMP
jgi:hypothetical protein